VVSHRVHFDNLCLLDKEGNSFGLWLLPARKKIIVAEKTKRNKGNGINGSLKLTKKSSKNLI